MNLPIKRCAIYTRKSSDEGLEQGFNSLDAQREACEAYIKSQANEGWRALATRYDDGGFSGGTMERPALRQLLADITARKIDTVVVYKIDRLTRALADFARIVELFDTHEASFVSVTQAFNTTSSMGRLTLNVLLSFAQFEREVTGERIRDKIAASKAKGMWMGGTLPLGYDFPVSGSRALVVNETEATLVRAIFSQYLVLGSVHALERQLGEQGVVSKLATTRTGKVRGGAKFSRGALFHLLRNRTYLGVIVHGDLTHPGLHDPIVPADLFDAVQASLDANARRHKSNRNSTSRAPLTGRLFDGDGRPISPTFSQGKTGKTYRYYVAADLQQGRGRPSGRIARLSAPALEAMIAEIVTRTTDNTEPLSLPVRIVVHETALHLVLPAQYLPKIRGRLGPGDRVERDASDRHLLRLEIATTLCMRGGRTTIAATTTHVTRRDPILIAALRKAHAMVGRDRNGMPILDTAPGSPYLRRLARLAFLAPQLQRDILDGRQPPSLTLKHLLDSVHLGWGAQAREIARA